MAKQNLFSAETRRAMLRGVDLSVPYKWIDLQILRTLFHS
ncbi:hypothetical protein J2Z37_000860 [Ammoniphilus resinae]|uniref:Uncharacterized protein n=1 Tax=Ammoniphilus resinae TaxID=861532 RepID=A0ABS4GKR6_9BACL|nr:hypothetical protein [Ammoniphilus resinae]